MKYNVDEIRHEYLEHKKSLIMLAKLYGSDVYKISNESGLTIKQISERLRQWGYHDLISETTESRCISYKSTQYIYGPDWDQIE